MYECTVRHRNDVVAKHHQTLMVDILCGLPQSDLLQTPLAGFNGRRGYERDVGSEETHI